MHRTLDISAPPGATDALLIHLERQDQAIGLSFFRGASIKPPGDVITVRVLNRGAEDIITRVARATLDSSIVTAETASIIDPRLDAQVENDVDEALWEELETGSQGRVTPNFLALMALGGMLACRSPPRARPRPRPDRRVGPPGASRGG